MCSDVHRKNEFSDIKSSIKKFCEVCRFFQKIHITPVKVDVKWLVNVRNLAILIVTWEIIMFVFCFGRTVTDVHDCRFGRTLRTSKTTLITHTKIPFFQKLNSSLAFLRLIHLSLVSVISRINELKSYFQYTRTVFICMTCALVYRARAAFYKPQAWHKLAHYKTRILNRTVAMYPYKIQIM